VFLELTHILFYPQGHTGIRNWQQSQGFSPKYPDPISESVPSEHRARRVSTGAGERGHH
jgi:hypothetical protein